MIFGEEGKMKQNAKITGERKIGRATRDGEKFENERKMIMRDREARQRHLVRLPVAYSGAEL